MAISHDAGYNQTKYKIYYLNDSPDVEHRSTNHSRKNNES